MREAEFLALVAHELKAPIAVITGLADTLSDRRDGMSDAEVDHCLDRISRQGDRLARLVADLLDLSQVESGSFRVSLVPVDLARAVEHVLDETPSPPGKSVELDIPDSPWARGRSKPPGAGTGEPAHQRLSLRREARAPGGERRARRSRW